MELGLYMKNYLILNELKTTIYYWLLHHKTIQNTSQEISSKIAAYTSGKVIIADGKLQPTYIHI